MNDKVKARDVRRLSELVVNGELHMAYDLAYDLREKGLDTSYLNGIIAMLHQRARLRDALYIQAYKLE